mmetsp:Transcript_26335/g.49824  ORF Transcript_26335/g.49824 Transcript_26335/m.49824 type:complete len:448 (+) Transcript_26335:1475-2818(+)
MSNFVFSSLPSTSVSFIDESPDAPRPAMAVDMSRSLEKNVLELRAVEKIKAAVDMVEKSVPGSMAKEEDEQTDSATAASISLSQHLANLESAGFTIPPDVLSSEVTSPSTLLSYLKRLRKYLLSRLSRRLLRQTCTFYPPPPPKSAGEAAKPKEQHHLLPLDPDKPVELPQENPDGAYKGWEPTPLVPTKASSQKLIPNLLSLTPAPSHHLSDTLRLSAIHKSSLLPTRSASISQNFLEMKHALHKDSYDRSTKSMQSIKKSLSTLKPSLSSELVSALHACTSDRDVTADYKKFILEYEDTPALRSLKKLKDGAEGLTVDGKKVVTVKTNKGYGEIELVNSNLGFGPDSEGIKYAELVLQKASVDDGEPKEGGGRGTGNNVPPVGVVVKRGPKSRAREARVRKLKRKYDTLNAVRNESWSTMKIITRAIEEGSYEALAGELFESDEM